MRLAGELAHGLVAGPSGLDVLSFSAHAGADPTGRSGRIVKLGEEHPVRRGSVVGRPPGTGVAHAFRGPLTLLAYGTRDTNDVCYYPRTKKIHWRGLGVAAQIDNLEPWRGL